MTGARGWGLPESHLLPDAIVAFVDDELSLNAHERVRSHIARCASCAGDVSAQRQARAEVKGASAPDISAGFFASLCAIPTHTELPQTPDNMAIMADGQLVTIQRPDRIAGLQGSLLLGSSTPLGGSTPLGHSSTVLGSGSAGLTGSAKSTFVTKRRATQGAGVVVSGLVLGALALVATSGAGPLEITNPEGTPLNVVRAHLGEGETSSSLPVTSVSSTQSASPTSSAISLTPSTPSEKKVSNPE